MSEWNYIIAAYAVTWGTVLGYAAYLELGVRKRARARLRVAIDTAAKSNGP